MLTRLTLGLLLLVTQAAPPVIPIGPGEPDHGSDPAALHPTAGDIFVTNFGGNTVTWYHGSTGEYGGVFVERGSGGLDRPVGLAFGADGALYVASAGTHQVLRYDGATGEFEGVFADDEQLRIPSMLQFGPDGNLYVGTFQGGTVLRFDAGTGALIGTAASGLVSPIGLRFDREGRLYVASAGENRVARFDPSGSFLDNVVSGAGLDFPTGVLFAPDGALLVGSLRSGEVVRVDAETGVRLDPAGRMPAGAGPAGLALDTEGRVLVADLNESRLLRIATLGGPAEVIATEGLEGPEGVAVKPGRS